MGFGALSYVEDDCGLGPRAWSRKMGCAHCRVNLWGPRVCPASNMHTTGLVVSAHMLCIILLGLQKGSTSTSSSICIVAVNIPHLEVIPLQHPASVLSLAVSVSLDIV